MPNRGLFLRNSNGIRDLQNFKSKKHTEENDTEMALGQVGNSLDHTTTNNSMLLY